MQQQLKMHKALFYVSEESLNSDDGVPGVTLAPNNSPDGGPLVIEMDSTSYYSSPSECQSETVLLPNNVSLALFIFEAKCLSDRCALANRVVLPRSYRLMF